MYIYSNFILKTKMSNMLINKIFVPIISNNFHFNILCGKGFFKPGDARKNPPDPKLRVKKNLEEGKGFSLKHCNVWKSGN